MNAALVVASLLLAPQVPPDSTARAGSAQAPDTVTLTPREQLRVRQRLRLERLARPPGADTLPAALDSAAAQRVTQGRVPVREGAPIGGGDSIMTRLLAELEGYRAMRYQGVDAVFQAGDRKLLLAGDSLQRPSIQFGAERLSADSALSYDERTGILETFGGSTYQPSQGDPLNSRRLLVNTETGAASAFGAQTQYTQGAQWDVRGDLPLVKTDTVYGSGAIFTSCDHDPPHYYFSTDELRIVKGHIMVARPVRLHFGDVPVAWLPFIAQGLGTGRSSGLLTPRFSVNDIVRTSTGYQRRVSNVGFYWAMSKYTDATVALDWFSDNFTALTANFRYNWLRQFMTGSASLRRFWRAEGGTELAVDATHRWQISERTNMNASVSFASSSSFVRRNSFDPRELTQEIRSQGGFNHRFDWGTLSLSGNRSQSLSDDRVDLTFPNLSLSIKTLTVFPAPQQRARWYNNMSWSGRATLNQSFRDLPAQAEGFAFQLADNSSRRIQASHTLTLSNFSLSQSLNLQENTVKEVPRDTLGFFPSLLTPEDVLRFSTLPAARQESELVDIGRSTLDWSTSLSYQQKIVGSTTFSPSVTFSGNSLKADTLEKAQSFVAAPTRVSFGATLRGDMYGFFPGFGSFEAIRHKVSPSFTYRWAPEVEPTDLQREVFGSRTLQPQSVLQMTVSQTFEAKRRPPEEVVPGSRQAEEGAPDGEVPDSVAADPLEATVELGPPGQVDPNAPRRVQQGEVVNLLGLRTSAVTYDFVQADSANDFLQGFTTTRLRNEISSDFLRGLTISFEHDLFADSAVTDADGSPAINRRFAPHLSALNLAFSLSSESQIFRWLGFGRSAPEPAEAEEDTDSVPALEDPFAEERSMTDESGLIPGRLEQSQVNRRRSQRRPQQGWTANVSYALNRPRSDRVDPTQNLQFSLRLSPTQNWGATWRTSYDLERGEFNDHTVRLTRDLHRWQANFDFLRTATGNWTFRFEVSLIDNRDLKFDYKQRNLPIDDR